MMLNEHHSHHAGSKSGMYHVTTNTLPYHHTPISFTTQSSTSSTTAPLQRCVCRHLWRRELHGLSQFMMTKTLATRIFWFLLLVLCFIVAIWSAVFILGRYVSDNTATRMRIKQVKAMDLPQMIFCPNSPDTVHMEPLLEDMRHHIGPHLNQTYIDILLYMMAGSGFSGIDQVDKFSDLYKENLRQNLFLWRGNRSVVELFNFVFEEHGLTCEEFFYRCGAGSRNVTCCEMFSPTYVMLRGRCFKLNNFTQNGNDELAKLRLFIKELPSPVILNEVQPLIVMYMGDEHRETSTSPRFYMSLHNWNKLRFDRKVIKSLPSNPLCSTETENEDRDKCMVYKWLMDGVVAKYNCTVPYFKDLDYMYNIPVCEPSVIVDNHGDIQVPRLERFKCKPACNREELRVSHISTIDYERKGVSYGYRLEAAYNELQYEEFDEIHTISLQHFISELGGQTGLFLGISLITFIQLLVSLFTFICGPIERWFRKRLTM